MHLMPARIPAFTFLVIAAATIVAAPDANAETMCLYDDHYACVCIRDIQTSDPCEGLVADDCNYGVGVDRDLMVGIDCPQDIAP